MTLRVQKLTVRFDDIKALDQITHTFEPATATAVMGVNGSGKTTLLETIAGLLKPTSGSIEGVPQKLAYVCQHHRSTWMPLTAGEVLAMGRYRERGLIGWLTAKDKAKMHEAGERLNINHLLNQSFGELSGGQQQRVRIAQGLAAEPQLLLLDEPITGVDIPSQERILAVIEDYAQQGTTVIVTTHHLDEARHCDSVLLLANRLIASGNPNEILTEERLRDAFSERLLGDHSEHRHDQDMIILDDHAHGGNAHGGHSQVQQAHGQTH
ncbi:MAG: metal ABC transporter ATP-binding protein [Acidimicrobiia bacterium]|nr:metal ABC transporter ATP-binding protein [Acidimicrobiia bacterium]MCY4458139.1 metal ABC transporter ATP-binding protein [Acidimicrobiaceae bacterium]